MSVKLKLECSFDGTGSSWTTLTSWSGKDYLLQARGVDITRGRDDETGEPISPGTIGFVLDNADYRFSPGITSSPCYPYLEQPGSLLRLSAWVNGAWQKLFYGTAQSWTATLDGDMTGKKSICTVSATDVMGAFPEYVLRQPADEIVRRTAGVAYHWPLRNSEAPISATIGNATMTSNAGDGLGAGTVLLPLEEGTDQHPLLKAATGGSTLTVAGLNAASSRPLIVIMDAPTANGVLFSLTGNGMTDTVNWSSSAGFYAGSVGTSIATGVPTSWPVLLDIASSMNRITARTASASLASGVIGPIIGARLDKIVLNPTLSGGQAWIPAHLIVGPNTLDGSALAASLLGPRIPASVTVASQLSSWGVGPSITGGTVGESVIPLTDGRGVAEVLSALATGMGARIGDNLDGSLNWVPFPPSGTPVSIPKVTGDLAWGTSSVNWCSDCETIRYDGSSYTATRPDGRRQTLSIEGVHATIDKDRSYADWLVWSGTLGGRCPVVPVDMMGLTESQRAALAAVDIGDRLSPPNMTYAPADLILICEGLEHHIDAETWTATFKTSPDIYSRLLIWDSGDTWDGGKLWAP